MRPLPKVDGDERRKTTDDGLPGVPAAEADGRHFTARTAPPLGGGRRAALR